MPQNNGFQIHELFPQLFSDLGNLNVAPLQPITDQPGTQSAVAESTDPSGSSIQQQLFDNVMNRNVKSITTNPDGSQKVDLHDDTNLAAQVLGLPTQPVQSATALPAPQDRSGAVPTGTLENVPTPELPAEGGGLFDFLGEFGNNNSLALLLGQIAQAAGGGDARIPGVGLGQVAQSRAQNEIFSQLFNDLLQANDFSSKPR